MEQNRTAPPLTRWLFVSGLVIFVLTVGMGSVIGTAGLHADQLSDQVVHTHLHSGTLGWITLGALGVTVWMFAVDRASSRILVAAAAVAVISIAFQLVSFWTDSGAAMAIAGATTTLAVLFFFGWAVSAVREARLTVPQLGVLLALFSFAVGGTIGVALGAAVAGWIGELPSGLAGAHPTGMMTGYLIPLAMGLIEWMITGREAGHRGFGMAQMLLAFGGFILLMAGSATDQMAIAGAATPLTVVAILIFLWRLAPAAARAWNSGAAGRFLTVAALGLPVYVAILSALIVIAVSRGLDAVSNGLLAGMDHVVFVGVMTNALFGVAIEAAAPVRRHIWSWTDAVVLVLANVGVAGFATSLIVGFDLGERIFAPVMGAGLALGIVVLLRRLGVPARPAIPIGTAPAVPAH